MAPSAPAPAASTASTASTASASSTASAALAHAEPKAPDKSAPPAAAAAAAPAAAHDQENKHLETLDDGALRALLDEAITYKSPKDREGKSSLFKELLEEAEQDEVECETSGAGSGGSWRSGREPRGGRRARRGERLPHSGSLQDLVAAALADVTDVAPQRRRHAPVSARTHHGGSLPSGVDRSFLMGEDPVRGGGADYIATVRCVNPPPLTERRVSVSDAHNATEMVHLNQSKIPCIPVTYTSRASLEICSGAVSSGRAHTTTTCSNQVDSGITFGCITTPAVVTSCSSTSSAPVSSATADTKPRSALANGLAGISRASYGSAATTCSADEFKKSLDENGNALTFNSPLSGSSQHKKPRRKKSSKNETVAMSEQIDGYQGNKEINELLRFIESNAEHGRQSKGQLSRIKHHEEDKGGKKRSTERRIKDKSDSKIKRANSMEELSLTKLEDLTHEKGIVEGAPLRKNKKERVSDGGAPSESRKSERRSWGDESRDTYYHSNSEEPQPIAPVTNTREKKKTKQNKSAESLSAHTQEVHADPPAETLDFQTVTKKKRTRKRHSPHDEGRDGATGGGGDRGDILYRKIRTPNSPDRRRKSAPPSDKSNDSNDDLDSVHSLPAEPTTERCAVRPASASSGGTPQASYADIARTRHNIPDLIESCNFYTDLEPAPPELEEKVYKKKETVCRSESAPVEMRKSLPKTVESDSGPAYDSENYPALETRGHRTLPRMKEKQIQIPAPVRQIERRPKPHMETVTAIEERITRMTPKAPNEVTEVVEEDGFPVTVIPSAVTSDPPDVVLAPDRRPPVILLDEAARPRDMDGITFGFDINEQLLNGEHRDSQPTAEAAAIAYQSSEEFPAINEKRSRTRGCDLVRDTMSAGAAMLVRVGGAPPLRYLPPAPVAERHSGELEKIVNYVGSAWEDIMKCSGSKVRYFSE